MVSLLGSLLWVSLPALFHAGATSAATPEAAALAAGRNGNEWMKMFGLLRLLRYDSVLALRRRKIGQM